MYSYIIHTPWHGWWLRRLNQLIFWVIHWRIESNKLVSTRHKLGAIHIPLEHEPILTRWFESKAGADTASSSINSKKLPQPYSFCWPQKLREYIRKGSIQLCPKSHLIFRSSLSLFVSFDTVYMVNNYHRWQISPCFAYIKHLDVLYMFFI